MSNICVTGIVSERKFTWHLHMVNISNMTQDLSSALAQLAEQPGRATALPGRSMILYTQRFHVL